MDNYFKQAAIGSLNSKMGFGIFPFLEVFDETFQKNASRLFSDFFSEHSKVTKWMVYSDYIIGDKNKKSDVITFTFAPYMSGFLNFEKTVEILSFKDVKKLRRVNPEFLNLLKQSPTLSVPVMLNKTVKLHTMRVRKMQF